MNTDLQPSRGDFLLDHHHLFADAWHGAGRLERRPERRRLGSWLFGRRAGFGAGLAVLALLYFDERLRVFLFWAAFILTRPLGATVGDFLDKPATKGGLELSRPIASAALAIVIVLLIVILPQRPGRHPGQKKRRREGDTIRRVAAAHSSGMTAPAWAGPPILPTIPFRPTRAGGRFIRLPRATVLGLRSTPMAGLDLNYGPATDVQLTATLPLSFAHAKEGWRSGGRAMSNSASNTGWLNDQEHGVSAAIFPRAILPTVDYSAR